MKNIFTSLIVPVLLVIVNLLAPIVPDCEVCNSTATVVCDGCNGEGFIYDADFDLYVVCGECGSAGEVRCTECSDFAQVFYGLKQSLEKNGN